MFHAGTAPRRPGSLGLTVVVALSLALDPLAGAVAGSEPEGESSGMALSVASEPAGAMVYVDGQPRGTTPLGLKSLAPGDHRVRVVKTGYLENSRVLTLRAGRAHALDLKLTPHVASTRHTVQVDPDTPPAEEKGGSGKKVALIALGVAAVGAGVYLALPKNKPPVAGTVTTSPAVGLAAVTPIAFSAQGASDPDNDPLTYTWDFGDGGSASGQSVTHVYNAAGTFNVSVRVSDEKETATATGTATVRSLAGTWTGNLDGRADTFFTFNIAQSGTTLSGNYSDPVNGAGALTGSVSAPLRVNMTHTIPEFIPGTWSGNLDADLNRITGTVVWFVGGPRTFTLVRR